MNTHSHSPLFLEPFLGLIRTCISTENEYHLAVLENEQAQAHVTIARQEFLQALKAKDRVSELSLAVTKNNQAYIAKGAAQKRLNKSIREMVVARADYLDQETVLDTVLNDMFYSDAIVSGCPICHCERNALKALQAWRIKDHALAQATLEYKNLLPWQAEALLEPFQVEMQHAEEEWHATFAAYVEMEAEYHALCE
jgi:hypothetical protein